jgi:cytochrome c
LKFALLRAPDLCDYVPRAFAPRVEAISFGTIEVLGVRVSSKGMDRQRDQMDSFELNKIMGAVLGTLLFVMGAGFVAEAIYHPIENRGPGYNLPEPEAITGDGGVAEVAEEVPLGLLLASADIDAGAAAVRKCQSCHTFGEGEPHKQGPNLYGVVGRLEGSAEGYSYSEALLAHNAAGDIWSYENLNAFLIRPTDYAPGTKMNFAGIRTAEERADILAYLQTLATDPVPFPDPEVAAAAPAGGAEDADAIPTESDELQVVDPADPTNPAITAPENVTAPVSPEGGLDTPTETRTETPVVGTPTTSGTPAVTELPGNDVNRPENAVAPMEPANPATPPAAQ